jgi:hypothetical protein
MSQRDLVHVGHMLDMARKAVSIMTVFSAGFFLQQRFDQAGVHIETRLLQLRQHGSQIEELARCRFAQHSQCRR